MTYLKVKFVAGWGTTILPIFLFIHVTESVIRNSLEVQNEAPEISMVTDDRVTEGGEGSSSSKHDTNPRLGSAKKKKRVKRLMDSESDERYRSQE